MEKVVVAMSGGIDSSVSAFLLKKSGYDVVGVTLNLFSGKNIKCCGSDDSVEKFKRICNHLGIRYYVKNAVKVFNEKVIDKFASDYLKGFTPNPCVECNRFLKFDYLFKIAKSLGASKLATGHYAIVEKKGDEYVLKRGIDDTKDQSYFLYPIKKEFLKDMLFPLGRMKKNEVKEIAKKNGIPLDINKESKDICFVPEGDYALWLKKNGYVRNLQGYFKDMDGKIIGTHSGYFKYTVGQRKGLGVSGKERMYVVKINPLKNEVTLGVLKDCYFRKILINDINWLSSKKPKSGEVLFAQIRYRHKPARGIIEYKDKDAEFVFDEPQFALTPGQSAVFYDGDRVMGGGAIVEAF